MATDTPYSDHLDTLVALVTHLAMTKYKARTPKGLIKSLSLDSQEVHEVLITFRGLFRQCREEDVSPDGEYYYTLQLRYARRWLEKGKPTSEKGEADPKEPLEAEYLATLLNFIADMVAQEQAAERQQSTNRATLIGAWTAAGVALIASMIALFGVFVQLLAAFLQAP